MGNDQLNYYRKCIMLECNMIYSYQVTLPTKLHMQVAGIEYRQSIESVSTLHIVDILWVHCDHDIVMAHSMHMKHLIKSTLL